MLRLTAQFADAWNSDWYSDPAPVAELMKLVDDACHQAGRDPATLVRTTSSNIAMPGYLGVRADPITGSTEEIAEAVAAFKPLGLRHHVAGLDPCTPTSLEQYARVMELIDRA